MLNNTIMFISKHFHNRFILDFFFNCGSNFLDRIINDKSYSLGVAHRTAWHHLGFSLSQRQAVHKSGPGTYLVPTGRYPAVYVLEALTEIHFFATGIVTASSPTMNISPGILLKI